MHVLLHKAAWPASCMPSRLPTHEAQWSSPRHAVAAAAAVGMRRGPAAHRAFSRPPWASAAFGRPRCGVERRAGMRFKDLVHSAAQALSGSGKKTGGSSRVPADENGSPLQPKRLLSPLGAGAGSSRRGARMELADLTATSTVGRKGARRRQLGAATAAADSSAADSSAAAATADSRHISYASCGPAAWHARRHHSCPAPRNVLTAASPPPLITPAAPVHVPLAAACAELRCWHHAAAPAAQQPPGPRVQPAARQLR